MTDVSDINSWNVKQVQDFLSEGQKIHSTRIYFDDYFGGTKGFSAREHGAYMLLMIELYSNFGVIEFKPKRLQRVCCLNTDYQWKNVWRIIQNKFVVIGNVIEKDGVIIKGKFIYSNQVNRRIEKFSKNFAKNFAFFSKGISEKHNENNGRGPNARARPQYSIEGLDGDDAWKEALKLCVEAARPALTEASIPLMDFSRIRLWLQDKNAPCDLMLDIIPALERLAARAKPKSVSSWKYFERAVLEKRDERIVGLPAPNQNKKGKNHDRTFDNGSKPRHKRKPAVIADRDDAFSSVLAKRQASRVAPGTDR